MCLHTMPIASKWWSPDPTYDSTILKISHFSFCLDSRNLQSILYQNAETGVEFKKMKILLKHLKT